MSVAVVAGAQLYEKFIKCGEILKSPPKYTQKSYIYRCIICQETFLVAEAFILHSDTHKTPRKPYSPRKKNTETNSINNDNEEHIKTEFISDHEEEDPLNTIKVELDESKVKPQNEAESKISQVPKSLQDETSLKDLDETTPAHESTASDVVKDMEAEAQSEQNDSDSEFELPGPSHKELSQKSDTEESDYAAIENIDCESEEDYEPSAGQSKKKMRVKRNKKQSASSFVMEFFKSEVNVTTLIESYRNQPDLWNNALQQSKSQREKLCGKIAAELKEKLNMQLESKEVTGLIAHIRKTFLVELRQRSALDDDDDGGDEADGKQQVCNKQTLKYFEQLRFLEPFIERNEEEKTKNEFLDELSEQHLNVFLDIYKNKACLWNTHLVEYHCKNKREEALAAMLQELESKISIQILQEVLQKYLQRINTYFMGEKRRRLTGKQSKKCNRTNLNPSHFKLMEFLNEHLGPFKCAQCEYSAQNSLSLRLHTSQHDGSIPFSCSLCDKQYQNVVSFRNHAKRHMNDCQHSCAECSRKFLNITELKLHMRVHTGAKPFCCDICGQSFRHSQTFNGHMRRHEKRYLHFCHICNRGFYSKEKVNNHVKAHLQIRDCICTVCGKAFTSKRLLNQHKVIHEDVRRFACQLCGKAFKHKTGVNQHMKTHGVTKLDTPS